MVGVHRSCRRQSGPGAGHQLGDDLAQTDIHARERQEHLVGLQVQALAVFVVTSDRQRFREREVAEVVCEYSDSEVLAGEDDEMTSAKLLAGRAHLCSCQISVTFL